MERNNFKNESNEHQALPLQEKIALAGKQLLLSNETSGDKNKKKRNSALRAASVARSAVSHVSRAITNKPGDFAHSGTNICYEN